MTRDAPLAGLWRFRAPAAAIAVIALAGCGGSMPVDNGPNAWDAGDQGEFMGGCEGAGASDHDCFCFLKAAEEIGPASSFGSLPDAGATAAKDPTGGCNSG